MERNRPYAAPGWLLPWWRNVAPQGAELAVVAVRDESGLIGLGPFFRAGRLYRTLGEGVTARVEPLARPGREQEVAREIAAALDGPLSLSLVPADSPWPELLAASWPGGARVELEGEEVAPVLDLEHDEFAEWLRTKSASFRKDFRRNLRAIGERHGTFRITKAPTYGADLAAFIRLHHLRWVDEGGSGALTPAIERMLAEVGKELHVGVRVVLFVLESDDDGIVSVEFALAAGGELAFFLGGYEPSWGAVQPSFQSLIHAIEYAFRTGKDRADLGVGGQQFKYRLANGEDRLRSVLVVPRAGRLRTAFVLAPRRGTRLARERLSDDRRRQLKRLLRR